MRRNEFLKTLLALSATGALPLAARAAADVNIKTMIPANPGGGWDTTGRALGKAMQEAGFAASVSYENKGGASGTIGLAQFVGSSKRDPNAIVMTGATMVGGILASKQASQLQAATPLVRLMSEYQVFVVPTASPLRNMQDVVAQLKANPGSVKWAGGSRGTTEHIAAVMIAREAGVDPTKVNYVAFRGGGEAVSAILGGNVTVGGSGYTEFGEYIKAGKMRALAVTSEARLPGIDAPTLKEQGLNVVIGNWRGVHGAPGITIEQRQAIIDGIVKATKTRAWQQAVEQNGWTPALLTGDEFGRFVEDEFTSLRATMTRAGMI